MRSVMHCAVTVKRFGAQCTEKRYDQQVCSAQSTALAPPGVGLALTKRVRSTEQDT